VVAKGYLAKLLANGAVKSYIGRHEPEILNHLELVVNTVSMEEAVRQRQQEVEVLPFYSCELFFMTMGTKPLSIGHNVQVLTELYLATTRDRAC
jgi:hypothetical protein